MELSDIAQEAREQQAAIAEILVVISRSREDVAPVFEAIARAAQRLVRADAVVATRFDGGLIHPMFDTRRPMVGGGAPYAPTSGSLAGRVVLAGTPILMQDLQTDPAYDRARFGASMGDFHRGLGVPLLSDGKPVGSLNIWWRTLDVVPERCTALMETFAQQAVIAIENVRLFKEIQEKNRLLELAGKHKSDFLAHMSHELRTPLNAIIGFSEVMASGMAGEITDQQKEFVGDIRDAGKHLLMLINDILDLSKIEAGRMEVDVAQFAIPLTVENALTLVRGRAEKIGIKLDMRIAPDVDDCWGDELKVKQILLNLLGNAVKFTPAGGTVTLSAHRVGEDYVISVKDTGIGIAPQDQERLFEEFSQVGSDQARKAEGTGLGLALTRKLVVLHGGRIWVESSLGSGSAFSFTLPAGRHRPA